MIIGFVYLWGVSLMFFVPRHGLDQGASFELSSLSEYSKRGGAMARCMYIYPAPLGLPHKLALLAVTPPGFARNTLAISPLFGRRSPRTWPTKLPMGIRDIEEESFLYCKDLALLR